MTLICGFPVVCITHSLALCYSFTTKQNMPLPQKYFFVLYNIIKLNKHSANSFSAYYFFVIANVFKGLWVSEHLMRPSKQPEGRKMKTAY